MAFVSNIFLLPRQKSLIRFTFEIYDVCEHHYQVALIDLKHEKHFQEQKQLNPIIPEQANHLISQSSVQRDDFRFC